MYLEHVHLLYSELLTRPALLDNNRNLFSYLCKNFQYSMSTWRTNNLQIFVIILVTALHMHLCCWQNVGKQELKTNTYTKYNKF